MSSGSAMTIVLEKYCLSPIFAFEDQPSLTILTPQGFSIGREKDNSPLTQPHQSVYWQSQNSDMKGIAQQHQEKEEFKQQWELSRLDSREQCEKLIIKVTTNLRLKHSSTVLRHFPMFGWNFWISNWSLYWKGRSLLGDTLTPYKQAEGRRSWDEAWQKGEGSGRRKAKEWGEFFEFSKQTVERKEGAL